MLWAYAFLPRFSLSGELFRNGIYLFPWDLAPILQVSLHGSPPQSHGKGLPLFLDLL